MSFQTAGHPGHLDGIRKKIFSQVRPLPDGQVPASLPADVPPTLLWHRTTMRCHWGSPWVIIMHEFSNGGPPRALGRNPKKNIFTGPPASRWPSARKLASRRPTNVTVASYDHAVSLGVPMRHHNPSQFKPRPTQGTWTESEKKYFHRSAR